ncbi:MAG: gas vesicle protein GvpG [Streptosporangiaceae bacterium]|jgi:hypothetical protein
MGLLTNLLLAPVTLPARGVGFIFREIRDVVDQELNDPDAIRRELLELQRRFEAGLVDEAACDIAEAELLARLSAIAGRQGTGEAAGGAG